MFDFSAMYQTAEQLQTDMTDKRVVIRIQIVYSSSRLNTRKTWRITVLGISNPEKYGVRP